MIKKLLKRRPLKMLKNFWRELKLKQQELMPRQKLKQLLLLRKLQLMPKKKLPLPEPKLTLLTPLAHAIHAHQFKHALQYVFQFQCANQLLTHHIQHHILHTTDTAADEKICSSFYHTTFLSVCLYTIYLQVKFNYQAFMLIFFKLSKKKLFLFWFKIYVDFFLI